MADLMDPRENESEEDRFLAYLDGAMAPEEETEFLAQLRQDAGMKQRFDEYEQTTHLLHKLGESDPDDTVNLLPNLERRMGLKRRSSPNLAWRLPLEVGGFLAVMLVAVLVFMHGLKQSEQVVVPEVRPGPVEIFLVTPPAPQLAEVFGLRVTEASSATPPRVWTTQLGHARVHELITDLGLAVGKVRGYPANPCEPCAVLLFEAPAGPSTP